MPLRRMTQAELDAFLEKAADILRGNVDHSEFRGYVFALLFFKRISDVFEESVRKLARDLGEDLANDPTMQKKSLPFVVPDDCLWAKVTASPPPSSASRSTTPCRPSNGPTPRSSTASSRARSTSTGRTNCRARSSWT
jgi:hypothetical protein